MCSTYQILKDFAGPVATILAASAAAFITWTFASRQVSVAKQQAAIAQQQARTALDQLRHNLFEKRYAIYCGAKDLIRAMLNQPHDKDFSASELAQYHIIINEARFFYSDQVCNWLRTLWKDDLKEYLTTRLQPGSPEFLASMEKLLRRLDEMPDRFQPELEFSQLTRPQPQSDLS